MYLCLKILVKPNCQNHSKSNFYVILMLSLTSNVIPSSPALRLMSSVLAWPHISFFLFFGQCWYMSVLLFPHSSESMLPLHSVSSINMFCCICFEVIIQELSNQSLIILSCGGSTIWMGSNLINTTFLVFIPLMTSAVLSVRLTSRSGFWHV